MAPGTVGVATAATVDEPADAGRRAGHRGSGRCSHRRCWCSARSSSCSPSTTCSIGSLQTEPDTSRRAAPSRPATSTCDNYREINARVDLLAARWSTPASSPAASSSARSSSACSPATRWPGCTSAAGARCSPRCCWCRSIPFQLLMIPLYVLIVRSYGLADTLPRDDPAVRDQLDGGVHLPAVLPAAAAGPVRGGPHRRRRRAADPVADRAAAGPPGAADRGAAHLHRAVERVPLAVPDHQGQPTCSRWPCRWPTT